MRYERTVLPKNKQTFKEWHEIHGTSQDALFDEFAETWQKVHVDDLPGSSGWMHDLKIGFFHHFEAVKYLYSSHARAVAGGVPSCPSSSSAICKRCQLTSPPCAISRRSTAPVNEKAELRIDLGTLTLPDFLGALVRISVMREKGSASDKLPGSLTKIIEENLLVLTPGFDSFDPAHGRPSPFASTAVRHKLHIHETHLKSLFSKWAVADPARRTIHLTNGLSCTPRQISWSDLDSTRSRRFSLPPLWVNGRMQCSSGRRQAMTRKELIFPEFIDAIQRCSPPQV